MRPRSFVLFICVLSLAGVAWAADYNDDPAGGNWDAAATWGGGGFPSAPADTAIIDESTVTVPASYVIPTITSIDVLTGGTLAVYNSASPQTATITLNGGTLTNAEPGGSLYGHNVTLSGTLEVEGDSRLTADDYWRTGWILTSPVVSTAAGAHKLTVRSWFQAEMWGVPDNIVRVDAASPAYTGGWDVEKGWLKANANGALGSGTVTVATGADKAGVDFAASQTGVVGPAITVNANGYVTSDTSNVTIDFTNDPVTTLNGGTLLANFYFGGGTFTWNDPINVAANSAIQNGCGGGMVIGGDITGAAGVTLTIKGDRNTISLNGDNSAFLGHLVVDGTNEGNPDRWLNLYVADGDFGGAADVTVTSKGVVAFTEDYTSAMPTVTAEANGRLQLKFNHNGGATPFTGDLTLDGGILTNQGWGDGYTSEMAGDLTLASDSYLLVSGEGNADLVISGKITGTGKLIQTSNGRTCYMSSTTSDWTGGTEIQSGTMEVTGVGALSTGAVLVNGSGTLRTAADGVLGACPSVTAEGGGIIKINSTEADTTKLILNPLGGLWIESGATPMDYTATGNIEAHTGAILHESIDGITYAYPAVDDIIPDGEGQKYLWKGAGDFTSVKAYTVGLGNGGVLKGLAAMSTSATMNANVTVTEHHAGDGFSLFSPGGTFDLAGPTFNGTGTVTLEGAGLYRLKTGAFTGTMTTLDYVGSGAVAADDDAAVGAGQVLNVHDGSVLWHDHWCSNTGFGTSDAPGDFATVNIKSGAMFWTEWGMAPTRGNIHVEDGGAIWAGSDWPAGAALSFDSGAQIVLDRVGFTTQLPTDGNATIVINSNCQLGQAGVKNIVLGNDSRLAGVGWYNQVNAASGDLVLAPGATQCRVTHYSTNVDQNLTLANKVNIPSGTLIVGDAANFTVPIDNNTDDDIPPQWTSLAQDGKIWLTNVNNVIDQIDVQAGVLALNEGTAAALGGADVHLAAGADIGSTVNNTVYTNMTFSGGGRVTALNWEGRPGSTSMHLTMAGSTLNPGQGSTAGILTVDVNGWAPNSGLNFAMGSGRCQIILDVVNDGSSPPVEGVDYDRLAVQSMAGFANADLTVNLPIPSVDFKPANLVGDTLTVLTTNMDLSSLTTGVDGWATTQLNTVGDPNDHWAGNINYINGGMTVTDLAWTAIPGDADLDGSVLLGDLSILAFNWESSTGMTWSTGDFDLDGTVNLADLSTLAFHWEQTEAGAPPVPEPMTVGLLAVGAAALLRRRRR